MKLGNRDPDYVASQLLDEPGKPVIAKTGMTYIVPVRFREIELVKLGTRTFVYGLGLIVMDTGQWCLLNVNAMLEFGPCEVSIQTDNGIDYYQFHFQPGAIFMRTTELVCHASLLFTSLEEFIFKGKMPKYVTYEDAMHLYDTAKKHTKTSANIVYSVVEFIIAYVARVPTDRKTYLREAAKTPRDFSKVAWVPMRSVFYSAPTSVSKLAGAYFRDGIVSALVNPNDRQDNIEKILRA